jgi:hypothetical protein
MNGTCNAPPAFTEPTVPGPTRSENNWVCAGAATAAKPSAKLAAIDFFAFIFTNNNCFQQN